MKLKYMFTITMFAAVMMFIWMPQVKAQISGHNYTVQWDDGTGNVKVNALYDAVMGDTAADGSRADMDRVYILLKGGVYWNTEHFQNDGYALRFVGQTPDPNDVFGNPPTLQMVARDDGTVDGHILSGYGDVYMKNLYIIASDQNGVQTYYQPMEFDGDNLHCVFDSVIFERSNFAITAWTSKGCDIYFTNCKWVNLVEKPITQQWTGRVISCWSDVDTLVMENCTFENVGCFVVQVEGGSAKYFRFVHNTMINVGRQPILGNWWQTAHIANNLFINAFFDGEGYSDYNPVGNPNRNQYTSGLFGLGTLPSKYGTEPGRRIVFANSAAFLAQTFKTAWDDTVRIQDYTNDTTDAFFRLYSPAKGGQMVIQDTMWLSSMPNFTKFDTSNYQTMIQFIKDIRAGVTPAPIWMQDLQVENGDTLWTAPQWPLAQNFTYSDANLMTAGTDQLPLGDLNWFPDKLADWNMNKAQYIKQIDDMAGAKIVQVPVGTGEAEDGTLSGDASVVNVQGFVFYRFESSGDILWTFDLPAAVPNSKLVVYTNLTGSNPRGENILLNGVNLTNNTGYGEYHYTSPPLKLDGWDSLAIVKDSLQNGDAATLAAQQAAMDLPAGTNTIEMKKSWGYQNFSGVNIYDASGNLMKELRIPDAVYDGGILTVQGAVWAPSALKSVNMGTNGTDVLSLATPNDASYRFRIFYQNINGDQPLSISEGSTKLLDLTLPGNTDSTGLDILSNKVTLTGGTHSITFTGGNFNFDYVQLIKDSVVAGVVDRNVQPISFSLSQNYPNPFNPTTNINFSVAKASNVKLIIYNILGQQVATLINNYMNAGTYTYQFNAANLASGVYLYSLEAGSFRMNKKMILLK